MSVPVEKQKVIVVVIRIVRTVNVPYHVCEALFDEKHGPAKRMTVGAIVAVIGVVIIQIETPYHWLRAFVDLFGNGLHALGATPFIEWVAHRIHAQSEKKK